MEAASEYVKVGPMPGGATGELRRKVRGKESFDPPPLLDAIWVYLSFAIITLVGHIRDVLTYVGLKKAGREASMLQEEVREADCLLPYFMCRHASHSRSVCVLRRTCSN